jgi:hypothetical protein
MTNGHMEYKERTSASGVLPLSIRPRVGHWVAGSEDTEHRTRIFTSNEWCSLDPVKTA